MNTVKTVAELTQELKGAVALVKSLRVSIKEARVSQRASRAITVSLRKQEAEARKAARIAKLEAQLEALRLKAQSPKAMKRAAKKPSKPVVVEKVA
jgi:hypothetical protein